MVIGAGRLGSSLALALAARGAHLAGFTVATAMGRARAETWLGIRAATDIQELVSFLPDIYVIAVPDDVLLSVADELGTQIGSLGAQLRTRPLVIHTSGATSVAVLNLCRDRGALTLVFHPLQTFAEPVSGSSRLVDAAVAITPGSGQHDSADALLGFALARLLGSRPFFLPDEKRSLYHAAATMASNYLVTLEYLAQKLFVSAGMADDEAIDLFLPLVAATLENLRDRGAVAALTGPLSRGDRDTVVRHLEALTAQEPPLVLPYQVLGLATLELVLAQGEVDRQVVAELAELLGHPVLPSEAGDTDMEDKLKRVCEEI